jgi:hypothetical protein
MSTVANEYAQSAQEQTLKLIRQSQQAFVEGFKGWVDAVEKVPSQELPTPEQVVRNGFAFAEELLKAQREFALGLVAAAEPLFEKVH